MRKGNLLVGTIGDNFSLGRNTFIEFNFFIPSSSISNTCRTGCQNCLKGGFLLSL